MINARPNVVAAHLYRHLAEPMPEPILDRDGNVDVERDDEQIQRWSEGTDDVHIDIEDVESFIRETGELLRELNIGIEDPSSQEYMRACYDAAKRTFGEDKKAIRTYFRWLYLVVFEYENGPRWGEFIHIYGVDEFTRLVMRRFREL